MTSGNNDNEYNKESGEELRGKVKATKKGYLTRREAAEMVARELGVVEDEKEVTSIYNKIGHDMRNGQLAYESIGTGRVKQISEYDFYFYTWVKFGVQLEELKDKNESIEQKEQEEAEDYLRNAQVDDMAVDVLSLDRLMDRGYLTEEEYLDILNRLLTRNMIERFENDDTLTTEQRKQLSPIMNLLAEHKWYIEHWKVVDYLKIMKPEKVLGNIQRAIEEGQNIRKYFPF